MSMSMSMSMRNVIPSLAGYIISEANFTNKHPKLKYCHE